MNMSLAYLLVYVVCPETKAVKNFLGKTGFVVKWLV